MEEKVTLYHRLGVDLVGVGRFGRNDPVELPAGLAGQWLAGQATNWSKEPWPEPPAAPGTDARPRAPGARKEDDHD